MSPDFILICLLKAPFLQDPHLGFLQCHFQLAGLCNLLLMLLVASEKINEAVGNMSKSEVGRQL